MCTAIVVLHLKRALKITSVVCIMLVAVLCWLTDKATRRAANHLELTSPLLVDCRTADFEDLAIAPATVRKGHLFYVYASLRRGSIAARFNPTGRTPFLQLATQRFHL